MSTNQRPRYTVAFADIDGFDLPENYLWILASCYDITVVDENPDFLFVGPGGFEHLKYDCTKIFVTGENVLPDFNLIDYGSGFDYLEFGDRYLRFPLYLTCLRPEDRVARSREYFAQIEKRIFARSCTRTPILPIRPAMLFSSSFRATGISVPEENTAIM